MSRSCKYSRLKTSPEESLLQYLASKFTYFTGDQWCEQIASGHLAVNGTAVSTGNGTLRQQDTITFSPPRALEPRVDEEHVKVVLENDDFIVVAKNGDLPVSEGGRYCQNTLVGLLHRRYSGNRGDGSSGVAPRAPVKRPRNDDQRGASGVPAPAPLYYPVHRLDKETSGLVVVAKSPAVAEELGNAFAASTEAHNLLLSDGNDNNPSTDSAKAAGKCYIAVLAGAAPTGKVLTVTARIGSIADHPELKMKPCHQKLKKLKMVCETARDGPCLATEGCTPFGKTAHSVIRILASNPVLSVSLAQVDILTGRSHQIRLHCAHVGFPVLGDKLYTTRTAGREGASYAVDDEAYLERVRATDPEDGGPAWMLDSIASQWQCRRHLLHAAVLSFPSVRRVPGEHWRFVESPIEWFLRDVSSTGTAEDAAACLARLAAMLEHWNDRIPSEPPSQ